MQHYCSLRDVHLQNVWLTIGSFDGVHKGHQSLIHKLTTRAHADGAPAVVLTFHPHPAVVLRNRANHFYLTSPEERATLLGEMDVDVVITYPFDEQVAKRSARDFVKELVSHLGLKHLCTGHDFALGRNREGDLPTLQKLGKEFGFSINFIRRVEVEGEAVSSSRIRAALESGDIGLVTRLLGRPYQVSGEVISGDGRGHKLGFPTANLDVWAERALPKPGVYACLASMNGITWKAVTNVGFRPTFNRDRGNTGSMSPVLRFNKSASPLVETHILDFKDDLYHQSISLSFIARLRDEKRFTNPQDLIDQVHQDIERARKIL
jgi:riboflavin kinase / FMN adenylyltransferase